MNHPAGEPPPPGVFFPLFFIRVTKMSRGVRNDLPPADQHDLDAVEEFLSFHEGALIKLEAMMGKVFTANPSDYVEGQLAYTRHNLSAIRWLREVNLQRRVDKCLVHRLATAQT